MDREDWMFWKAMLPGGIFLVAAVLMAGVLSNLPDGGRLGAAMFNVWRWAPLLLGGWGLLQMAAAGYRFWQWHRGSGYECQCGGLLGAMRLSRSYRRCLGCGRRHYEQP